MKPSVMPTIAAMQADTPPGCCAVCQDPLPKRKPGQCGRERVICRKKLCKRAYHRVYSEGRREERWARGLTSDGKQPKTSIKGHRALKTIVDQIGESVGRVAALFVLVLLFARCGPPESCPRVSQRVPSYQCFAEEPPVCAQGRFLVCEPEPAGPLDKPSGLHFWREVRSC